MSSRRESIASQAGDHTHSPLHHLSRSSKVTAIWETTIASSILFSTFLVTFQAAFHAGIVWQLVIVYLLDVLYLCGVLLRFLTGYKARGVVVTERRKIALQYAKTALLPDLFSLLPLEIFALAASDNVGYIAAFLRLNRCSRCYRVWTYLCKFIANCQLSPIAWIVAIGLLCLL